MDNQHRKIRGYRDLSQAEIDLMNEIKEEGFRLEELVEKLFQRTAADPRWVSIGKTHLQQGLMALTRSVAQPGGF